MIRLVAEAEHDLLGSTIEQIRRTPDRLRLIFVLGSRRGKTYVVLGVRGPAAAFFWTRDRERLPGWDALERTEAFNRLRSTRLIHVGAKALDRVVRFEFERDAEEEKPARRFSLVAGWLGSASNVWLLDPDDDAVLEPMHTDTAEPTRGRREKHILELPAPPPLTDWRSLTFPEYRTMRRADEGLALPDFLRRRFWGIDSGLTKQVERRLQLAHSGTADDVASDSAGQWEEFQAFLDIGRAAIDPEVALSLPAGVTDPGRIEIASAADRGEQSLAELLAKCDAGSPAESETDTERAQVRTAIATSMKRVERRLASLERTEQESVRADDYKKLGDLLHANRPLLHKGMTELIVEDWESGRPVTIALSAARSPQQNIDDYYRKSRKATDAGEAARAERPALLRERERLRAALARLETPSGDQDSAETVAAWVGLEPQSEKPAKGTQAPRLPYREFVIGRARIWVGRSSRDNDELTKKLARPQDIFFHVHGASGSHVILRRESGDAEITKDVLIQAAQAAAYFSKAKHAGVVPVVYTEARFVRKPRKAPAGTVSVEREKTIMVKPLPPPGYHDKNPPG